MKKSLFTLLFLTLILVKVKAQNPSDSIRIHIFNEDVSLINAQLHTNFGKVKVVPQEYILVKTCSNNFQVSGTDNLYNFEKGKDYYFVITRGSIIVRSLYELTERSFKAILKYNDVTFMPKRVVFLEENIK